MKKKISNTIIADSGTAMVTSDNGSLSKKGSTKFRETETPIDWLVQFKKNTSLKEKQKFILLAKKYLESELLKTKFPTDLKSKVTFRYSNLCEDEVRIMTTLAGGKIPKPPIPHPGDPQSYKTVIRIKSIPGDFVAVKLNAELNFSKDRI